MIMYTFHSIPFDSIMVKKTRRASKISKRRKNNTRSKRGRGRRTVKRGGMKKHAAHAAHAARSAHAAAAGHAHKPSISGNPHTHTHTPGYMPRAPFLEVVGQELNKKFEDPVEMGSSYMGAHDAATKALHNENVHNSFGTPVCRTKYSQFGPSVAGREPMNMSNPPNYVYSTPADASSYLRSPPPPTDLFVRGTGIPLPYNPMGFAPGAPGAPPAGVVRSLDADFDMLPPTGLPPVAPVAPVAASSLSPQRLDYLSSTAPNTFPKVNMNRMNRMNRMNCNKNSGSP
jgi:hypothetical protein